MLYFLGNGNWERKKSDKGSSFSFRRLADKLYSEDGLAAEQKTMRVNEILETCIYVDDLLAAERFYTGVLGLELVSRQVNRHVFFRCGNRMLLVFNPDESNAADSDLPRHGCRGAGHVAFGVPQRDIARWQTHFAQHGVAIEKTIDWPQGGRSLYFRDPAGNSVEIATPRIWGLDESDST